MMTKQDWEFQIGHIEGWLAEHGYELVQATDEEDQVELAAGVVRINSRQHPETRFYTLLHEAGHVDIFKNGAAEFADEHPMYVQAEDGRSANSKAFRVSLLAEELEAWRIGRRLAHAEDLFIDDAKFDKLMANCVMTYINWAADQRV
jgi:hypothetical protein